MSVSTTINIGKKDTVGENVHLAHSETPAVNVWLGAELVRITDIDNALQFAARIVEACKLYDETFNQSPAEE